MEPNHEAQLERQLTLKIDGVLFDHGFDIPDDGGSILIKVSSPLLGAYYE
jgi:hypothetical protein